MSKDIKVLVVSHSYVTAENQKNIDALEALVELLVVVPKAIKDRIHDKLDVNSHSKVVAYSRFSLWGSQYLLSSVDLGLRQFRPDIIHVEYDPWSVIYWQTWLAKILFARNAKLICTVKNNTYRRYSGIRGWLKNTIADFFVKRCDFFIAVNNGVKDIYQNNFNVSSSKLEIMQHLGVDTLLFKPGVKVSEATKLNIGFCGRFDEEKGIRDLINALTPIVCSNSEIILSLLGDGVMKDELHAMGLPWLRILDRVPHNEVSTFMQTLDIFVLPSKISEEHEEHDAHVLLEAMACGVAVIGSSSGIIPEVIEKDRGLLFDASDVSALTKQLSLLISSEQLRIKYATIGLKKVETDYSIDVLAQKKQHIYQHVLQQRI